jgi:hypothetical protein
VPERGEMSVGKEDMSKIENKNKVYSNKHI